MSRCHSSGTGVIGRHPFCRFRSPAASARFSSLDIIFELPHRPQINRGLIANLSGFLVVLRTNCAQRLLPIRMATHVASTSLLGGSHDDMTVLTAGGQLRHRHVLEGFQHPWQSCPSQFATTASAISRFHTFRLIPVLFLEPFPANTFGCWRGRACA